MDDEVLHIHDELTAKHISDADGGETNISAAVRLTVHSKLSVIRLLCHTPVKCRAFFDIPLDIQGLIFAFIERPHIVRRQFLYDCNINGSRV